MESDEDDMRADDDPWDDPAWQQLWTVVDERDAELAAEATRGLNANDDLDAWLTAIWDALEPWYRP